MAFDPTPHLIKLIIIRCGQLLHPEEKDITKLYEETSVLLGMAVIPGTTKDASKSPAPHEMEGVPKRTCPNCKKSTLEVFGLCRTCAEAEGGKYNTLFECSECHYKEKSEKHLVQWLREMGVEFQNQSKKSLGVKTITDEGVKE